MVGKRTRPWALTFRVLCVVHKSCVCINISLNTELRVRFMRGEPDCPAICVSLRQENAIGVGADPAELMGF